jgi:hypothetical protein
MTYESIKDECDAIQVELETLIPDGINEVVERAKILSVYMSRSGYLLAEAKKIARSKKSSEISETIIKIAKEGFLSAKAQNALVETIAADELYLADRLDRINAACTHSIDLCRTIISKEKAEMAYLQYQK